MIIGHRLPDVSGSSDLPEQTGRVANAHEVILPSTPDSTYPG
ncbi:hypothetical protein [Algoriphagus oliviformis]|nr:hypothetical protein [Algoriphagus oliviformis]